MSDQKKVFKSAGIISGSTLLSRILGLARDILTARVFGTSFVYDAFVIAFMVPNLLRGLLGEGALNAAFIPVFSSYVARGEREKALRMAHIVMTVMAVVLSVAVIIIIVSAQALLGWGELSLKCATTLQLLQVMAPYMVFICLAAMMMGLLNAFHHFIIPALAPVILNICWILALLYLCPMFGDSLGDQIYGLAVGILFAGCLQLLVQIPMARKHGFYVTKMSWDLAHPGVRKMCRLMIPVVIAYAVNQINVVVDLMLAYYLGEGMQSALWYAQRIIYFPLGVFGVAMSIAIMPTLSRLAAQKQLEPLLTMLGFALRVVLMIIGPCAVAILVLNREMVSLFYERGAFGLLSVNQTSMALFFYAIGLIAFAGNKILVPAYYAMQDTKTPVRIGLVCVILNLLLNLILMGPLQQGGLALATALSAFVNLGLLFYFLEHRVGRFDWYPMLLCIFKVCVVSVVYAYVCYWTRDWVVMHMEMGLTRKIAEVFLPLTLAFTVLGLMYYFIGREDLQKVMS